MAKQQKPPVGKATPPNAKATSSETGTGGYILRNLAIVAVLGIIFYAIDARNDDQTKMRDLTEEFYALQRTNSNQQRQKEIYEQVMGMQSKLAADTGAFARATRGYHWAIHDLALGNLKGIEESKEKIAASKLDSTEKSLYETKMGMKVGLYPLIQHMIKSTPEDAVILLPEGDSVISNTSKWNFIYDPEWTEYFIYPRLCVAIGRENEHPELAKRVTHVLIIEGKGYEKLKYNVPMEMRAREAVLPINSPPAGLNLPQ